MWNVIEQMMLVGWGTRQCHRSPLLQEGSDAGYRLPESRFPMRFGFCSPLLTPPVLGADVEDARLHDGGAAGTSTYSNITWLQAAEAEGAQSGLCSPAWVQDSAQQFPPSWAFLLLPWKPKPGDRRDQQRWEVQQELSLQCAFCMGQTCGRHSGCLLWV